MTEGYSSYLRPLHRWQLFNGRLFAAIEQAQDRGSVSNTVCQVSQNWFI
jgi:hypothetical protein